MIDVVGYVAVLLTVLFLACLVYLALEQPSHTKPQRFILYGICVSALIGIIIAIMSLTHWIGQTELAPPPVSASPDF